MKGYIMSEISFKIIKNIAILSTNKSGWTKELNLVSWNGRDPKYDLRDWSPDHKLKGKGLTFTQEEINKLRELLNNI